MKAGDPIIWLCSPGRSILSGWRIQKIPGVITRVCRQRIMIRVRLAGCERLVIVDPDNVLREEEEDKAIPPSDALH